MGLRAICSDMSLIAAFETRNDSAKSPDVSRLATMETMAVVVVVVDDVVVNVVVEGDNSGGGGGDRLRHCWHHGGVKPLIFSRSFTLIWSLPLSGTCCNRRIQVRFLEDRLVFH